MPHCELNAQVPELLVREDQSDDEAVQPENLRRGAIMVFDSLKV